MSASGQSAESVTKAFHLLSTMMRQAVLHRYIPKSPCEGVKLPKVVRREMRFLSAEELHRLAEEVPERYWAFVITAGYTGARWSELVALKTTDLTLLERRLTIQRASVEVRGHLRVGPPKTESSIRSMTLPAFVVEAVAAHLAKYPSVNGLVFSGPRGGPLRRSWTRRHFKPAARRMGIDDLRFHDLRHTSVGLAISAGAHPKVIQMRLGHGSIKVTLDRYGHLFPNLDHALADSLHDLATSTAAAFPPRLRGFGT